VNTYTDRALIEGLVGDHMEEWHHSPTFRSAVRTLADMLPAMVDGLAEACKAKDKVLEQMHQLARIPPTAPPNFFFDDKGKAHQSRD